MSTVQFQREDALLLAVLAAALRMKPFIELGKLSRRSVINALGM
jgi:hypothetical protein